MIDPSLANMYPTKAGINLFEMDYKINYLCENVKFHCFNPIRHNLWEPPIYYPNSNPHI